jgi:di/tricarboxylate transporter
LPAPPTKRDLLPALLFVTGLVLTAADIIPMVQVAVTLACIFVLGGWVRAADIRRLVDWQLLILIGSALGVAVGMQESHLAHHIAQGVLNCGLPKVLAPTGLYFIIMVVTEFVTNNAAAALGVPLAISMSEEMGLKSPKALVMVVMLAASTSYASPIGYATNLMVKGPGGYSFKDFLRIGLMMDLIWMLGVSLVLPAYYSMD